MPRDAFFIPISLWLVCLPVAVCGDVLINEFVAASVSTPVDEDGDAEDWIELYNSGTEAVDLAGYGLSDDPGDPFRWVFPAVTIGAGDHLLIWASGKDRRPAPGTRVPGIIREFYRGIGGGAVGDLRDDPSFPHHPESREMVIDRFEAPRDVDDHYGQRMRGYLRAPETGSYTFWIAGDNGSSLYLDSGGGIDLGAPIATIPDDRWSDWREWDEFPSQQSQPVFLEEGHHYEMVALMKEDVGGDHLAVAWRLPDGTFQGPIPGEHFFGAERKHHANFSIRSDGEPLTLTDPEGVLADAVDAVSLPAGISFGRVADGGGEWGYFDQSTPGGANAAATSYAGILDPPDFSRESGFHPDPFSLALTAADPEVDIAYSLDGTEPTDGNGRDVVYQYKNDYPGGDLLSRTMRSFSYDGELEIAPREVVAFEGIRSINTEASSSPQMPWSTEGAELVQSSRRNDPRLMFGDPEWTDYEFTVQARKTSGAEGFLIYFRADADGDDYYQLNLGGWGNTEHAIQKGGIGRYANLRRLNRSIQRDRWYDIRIRVDGNHFRCWLDGELLFSHQDTNSPNLQGRVGLSTWGTEARFRNIEVRPLNGGEPLFSGIPTRTVPATVVRARAFREGYLPSETVTHTYFVGPGFGETQPLPIVSVATDESNLFGYERGIYVAGRNRDQVGTSNFDFRGQAWERPGHVTLLEPDGEVGISQLAGLRTHGGFTRNFPQKSLRLYARRSEYGKSHFTHQVFPGQSAAAYKRLLLRNSGNDNGNTMFRDAAMQRLVAHWRLDTQAYRPANVYLNGEYWGIQNLRERFDRHYLGRVHGVDPDNLDILEFLPSSPHGVKEGDDEHYVEMLGYIEDHDLSNPQHYAEILTRIDVENFIDYHVAQIYFNNTDWPNNNHDYWRLRTDGYDPDAPYGHDGRWRWLLFDTDFGFGLDRGTSFNTLEAVTETSNDWWRTSDSTFLLRNLLASDEFKTDFINRFAGLLNTAFRPERVTAVIDEMEAVLAPEMPSHIERWGNISSWPAQVQVMRDFGNQRPGHMRSHLRSKFNLSESWVTLDVSDPASGHMVVNRSKISAETPGVDGEPYPWSGRFFDVPIRVEAVAAPGYRFSHWAELDGSPEAESEVLTFVPGAGLQRTAVFVEAPQSFPIHFWHFNDLAEGVVAGVPADHRIVGNPVVVYAGLGDGFMDDIDGSDRNARLGEAAGKGLRVRNPADGRALEFSLPTTGYRDIRFSYAARRTNSGARGQVVEYRTGLGEEWSVIGDPLEITEDYQLFGFDFTGNSGVEDNPDFQVRIRFTGEAASGTSGNNRFDNVVVEGVPLEGVQPPPRATAPVPAAQLAEGEAVVIDLGGHFSGSEGGEIGFAVQADRAGVVETGIEGSLLTVNALERGGATLTITADDGVNPPVETSFDLLVFPRAHRLDDGSFAFDRWSPEEPENRFPEHMLFLQSDLTDPGLDADLDAAYLIPAADYHEDDRAGFPYDNSRRTRLNGLGREGISFINTGRGRDLGGALVVLDTTGHDSGYVSWKASTVEANSRVYRIRLQYRTSTDEAFSDVLDESFEPVEYIRSPSPGEMETLGPVALPADALGQPELQLLWRYYHTGERLDAQAGARDELRLDDILITTGAAEQEASRFEFEELRSAAQSGRAAFPVVVAAVTEAGIPDGRFEGEVTLSVASGPGGLTGTLTGAFENGRARFDDLVFAQAGFHTLQATGGGFPVALSEEIQVAGVTELIVPRFIQGGRDGFGGNFDRVPFAYRIAIDGLTPGATYRYANRVVVDEDAADQDGAGNMIFVTGADAPWIRNTDSPGFALADFGARHHEFTADASGKYRGWFVTEPSGNDRFAAGNSVTLRVLLNDGRGGDDAVHFLDVESAVDVLSFGPGPAEGSAVVGRADSGPRSFVVLYGSDETRPLAAVPVEATGSEIDERYAGFYRQSVANRNGYWGALVPNALPSGIRRIEERSIDDGAVLGLREASNGLGGTVNPSRGLAAIDLGGPVTTYEQWLEDAFADPVDREDPSISGPEADPLGRGIPNLLRYAFDLPMAATAAEPGGRIENREEGLFVVFPRRAGATDIAYLVEASDGMDDWEERIFDSRADEPAPGSTADEIFVGVTPGEDAENRFFRVRVLLTTP